MKDLFGDLILEIAELIGSIWTLSFLFHFARTTVPNFPWSIMESVSYPDGLDILFGVIVGIADIAWMARRK